MIIWHNHHIIPKHMGGTDDTDNIIRVNIPMHAFLHKCLYEEYGHWEDKIAWKALSGHISKAEAIKLAQHNYMTNRIITDECRKNMSEGQRRRCADGKHPMLGRKFSSESKSKMSKSHKGQIPWNKGEKMSSDIVEKNRQIQLNLPILVCPHCNKKVKNPGNMNQHIRAKHSDKEI